MEFVNTPLRTPLLLAYGIKDFQLTVPGWMNNSLRFEIQANIPTLSVAALAASAPTSLVSSSGESASPI